MGEMVIPKVFFSYSWTTPEHEKWVLELATKLMEDDRVDVVLDKWETVEGQNLNKFMERSVNDPSIQKVLIISDHLYVEKANGQKGGVGTETVIISSEVYKDAEQTKFIPIVAERGPDGEAYLPTYFNGSKYIDLSNAEIFEEEYERLVRNLHGKPEHKKPVLGSVVKTILEDDVNKKRLKSYAALMRFKHQSSKNLRSIDSYSTDFVETFMEDFRSFAFRPEDSDDVGDLLCNAFASMQEMIDIYVDFLEYYIREAEVVDSQTIIEILEGMYPIVRFRSDSQKSFYESQFEHMELFLQEIVLYTIALLYKNRKFNVIKNVVSHHYIVGDEVSTKEGSIDLFRPYLQLLESRQPKSGGTKYTSYAGHLLKQHANNSKISFEKLVEADLLLSLLDYSFKASPYSYWYPVTSPYIPYKKVDFILRLKSKPYFEQVKSMYGVSSGEELATMLKRFKEKNDSSFETRYIGFTFEEEALKIIATH